MELYAFTESSLCICTVANAQAASQLAKDASDAAVWALAAAAAIFVGGVFGSVELAKDLVLLGADQAWFQMAKRRSRCTPAGTGVCRMCAQGVVCVRGVGVPVPAPHTGLPARATPVQPLQQQPAAGRPGLRRRQVAPAHAAH